MSKIKESASELIGRTPLLKLNRYTKNAGVEEAVILGKLEYLNPAGSVKDRIALAMIVQWLKMQKKRESKSRGLQLSSQHLEIQGLVLQQLQQRKDIRQS